jgi:hypothetical protein
MIIIRIVFEALDSFYLSLNNEHRIIPRNINESYFFFASNRWLKSFSALKKEFGCTFKNHQEIT